MLLHLDEFHHCYCLDQNLQDLQNFQKQSSPTDMNFTTIII